MIRRVAPCRIQACSTVTPRLSFAHRWPSEYGSTSLETRMKPRRGPLLLAVCAINANRRTPCPGMSRHVVGAGRDRLGRRMWTS